jgi:hypothetical protein
LSYIQVVALLNLAYPLKDELQCQPGYDESLDYEELAHCCLDHFSHYIQGIGHPQLDSLDTSHHLGVKNDAKGDPTFRARLFLKAICVMDYLPVDPSAIIKVHVFLCLMFHMNTESCISRSSSSLHSLLPKPGQLPQYVSAWRESMQITYQLLGNENLDVSFHGRRSVECRYRCHHQPRDSR